MYYTPGHKCPGCVVHHYSQFYGNYTLEFLVWATSFVPLYGIWEQSFGPYEWHGVWVRCPASSESRLFAIERSEMSERRAPSEDGDGTPHSNQLVNGISWYVLMEKATPVSSESRLFAIERSEMSERRVPSAEITSKRSEEVARWEEWWARALLERNHDGGGRSHHPICISFCTSIYTCPNDIRRGTNLWLVLTDNTFEQFDENHDFDQIDGNYTLENYMEKGVSVGSLECKFMALFKITHFSQPCMAPSG